MACAVRSCTRGKGRITCHSHQRDASVWRCAVPRMEASCHLSRPSARLISEDTILVIECYRGEPGSNDHLCPCGTARPRWKKSSIRNTPLATSRKTWEHSDPFLHPFCKRPRCNNHLGRFELRSCL